MNIKIYEKSYKPLIGFILGAIIEPLSKITNKTYSVTWDYWGFQTIICATKNA